MIPRQSDTSLHVLHLRDSKRGISEKAPDEFNIREYFTQHGFSVVNLAVKASGHVFLTSTGSADEIEKLWQDYYEEAVNPLLSTAQNLLYLKQVLPKLSDGSVSEKERDKILEIIVRMALLSHNVEP